MFKNATYNNEEVLPVRNALRNLRREVGLSQYQFAKKVGVSRSFYSQIETGVKNPSFRVACRIKLALNTLDDSVFQNTPTEDKPKRGAPFKD